MAQAGPSRLGGGGGGSRGAGEAPGGGPAPLIRLRSKAPLPLFTCPHPIPSASSTIGDSLKLSVLRLLTGEVNERSSTAPMTESELLKLRTIHGWRMEMIALELRQNVLIAPETRDKIGEGVEDEMEGFELVDDADCGLLEADDEVLIRLKPAFSLSDLHLPKLSSNHHYALPAGALTRAGTLSSPPPYSQVNVKRAAEPSSHSSSVQGQPNANFHARQWRDYSRGPRAVIAGAVTAPTAAETKEAKKARATSNPALNGPSRPLGLGMGVEPPAAVPSATTYKAPPLKQRRSKTNTADQGPSSQAPQSSMVPLISPPASAASAVPAPLPPAPQRKASESKSRPVTGGSGQDKVASVSSPPPSATASNFGLASATTPTTATTATTATSSSAAGQESMPLTALVIGPGVQGAVGRGTSSAAMGHSGPAQVNGSTSVPDDYGNAKAFASFTAAGGEVQHRAKPRRQSSSHSQSTAAQRKMSQHSRTGSQEVAGVTDDGDAGEPARAAVEAAQRRAAAARAAATAMSSTGGEPTPLSTSPEPSAAAQRLNGDHNDAAAAAAAPAPPAPAPKTRPSGKERKSSSKRERVELPEPPVLPPITNLAPFPEDQPQQQRETLPPMPTPADVGKGTPALRRKQSSKSGEDGAGLAAPARRPTLDGRVSSTTSGAVRTGESTPTTSRSNSPVVTRRPSYNVRQASTGAESNGSAGGTASRLARLAAPGLGLGGFGRKKSSTKGSATPKTTGNDDAATSGADGDADGLAGGSEPTTPAEQPASNTNGALATTPDEPASTPPATSTSTSSAPLSRAERRYLDFQKSQQAEMSRQHAAERDRLAAMEKERREKQERAKKREEEERQRKHKEKDEVWQEVRRRAAMEKEKEREKAAAAVGMTRKHSSGVVAAATAGAGGGTDSGHDGGGHGGGGHDGGGGGGGGGS